MDEEESVDPEVQFLLAGGEETIEQLLDRVRGNIERVFQDSLTAPGVPTSTPTKGFASPTAKQQVKTIFQVDYTTKTFKDLLHFANTRDPHVQTKAIAELIARWPPRDEPNPAQTETFVRELKVEGGLRTLMNLAADNKGSVDPLVVKCQVELIKLLSLMTESQAIRDQIRQTGGVPTFIQMLATWVEKLDLKKDIIIHGLSAILNLCVDDVNVNVIRKLGGLPHIVGLVLKDANLDIKTAATKTLIMLSASSVKNQEAIVTDTGILEYLFQAICKFTPTAPAPLDGNYRQLLLNLSACAKSRAITPPKTVLALLPLLRVVEIYPKLETYEIRKYYRNADIPFDGLENNDITTRQASLLDILTNFMQNEHQRQAFASTDGLNVVFSYFAPLYNIPFDMFKWNYALVTHAIKLSQNLVLDDTIRAAFIAKEGYSLMCKVLTLTDVFPPNLLLTAGELLSTLGTGKSGGQLANFGTEGMPPLLRLLSMFPTNERLQLLVARIVNSLASEERHRMFVFQEGGLQVLNTLCKSENDDVAAQACEALSHLSHDKFMRRVARVMGTIVPTLLHLVSIPKLIFQKPCIIVLYNLTLEDEGRDLICDVNSGITPSVLTPLMQSSDEEIQACALKLLAVCTKKETYFRKFMELQGLPPVLEVLMSQNASVQAGAVELLGTLVQNVDGRETLTKLGLVDKLKQFSKHANVVKPNSELVEPMRGLILKLKSAPVGASTSSGSLVKPLFFQCTLNGETKLLRVPSAITYSKLQSNLRQEFGLSQDVVISVQYTGRMGVARVNSDIDLETLIPKLSASETHQFLVFAVEIQRSGSFSSAPPSPKESDAVSALRNASPVPPPSPGPQRPPPGVPRELFQLLGQLDEVQLRSLVVELLKRNPSLNVIDSIKTVLAEEEEELVAEGATPVLTKALSSTTLLPPAPKPAAKPAAAGGPPPPPPVLPPMPAPGTPPAPAMFKLKRKPQPNKYSAALQNNKEKDAPSYSSVLKELSTSVSGGIKLKHVNVEEEREKRRKEKQDQNANSILKEIEQVGKLRAANKGKPGKSKILVDQSVVPAMQIWRKDLRKWNEELQANFDRNAKLVFLIFKLAEMREDEMPFADAETTIKSTKGNDLTQERFVDFLLRAGFSVKKNRYQEIGKEVYEEEYKTVMRPANLPIRYLLRAILLALPGGAK